MLRMTDQQRPSAETPKPRRRGPQGAAASRGGEASTGPEKQGQEKSATEGSNKRRRRRRGRRGGANKPEQATPRTEDAQEGGQRRRGRRGRRPNRDQRTKQRTSQRYPERSHMQTNDETSAGGLVVSGLAEAVDDAGNVDLAKIYVALIGRLDRRGRLLWSMPKGHVEPGENRAATAEREVWEETGIHGKVFAELGVIDYWFVSEGTRIHKTVHHHLLSYVDGDLNDEDPEVTEVAWVPASELIERLAYADERKLARIAHDLIPDFARAAKAEGKATPR
ncbi:NUDIX hydrolase [Corynebacterium sp. H128]|uniref:NUDIX hydrolase n=1 Tax=Corynebacterium sp. H128 TaxID=3133427 RepID=UPI00403F9720